ncbi:MAG: hypothetical protein DIU71_10920 [Proteobacteria bacterium]|nr:MAG: hypothetical protein DIU71_10920 [Pseudomonadota bacterium]
MRTSASSSTERAIASSGVAGGVGCVRPSSEDGLHAVTHHATKAMSGRVAACPPVSVRGRIARGTVVLLAASDF